MKNCIIHFIPALSGDCFVLEFSNRECIIIDCGFTSTYKNELKPLLMQLKDKGCKVILLIITHTDRDHIEGAIEFIKDNGHFVSPQIIPVENIWYNGIFDTLIYNFDLQKRMGIASIEQKQKSNLYIAEILSNHMGISDDVSAKKSLSFEQLCVENGYKLNSCFSDNIIQRDYDNMEDKVNHFIQMGDFKINILSPSRDELIKLSRELHCDIKRTLGKDYFINKDSEFLKLCELVLESKTENINFEENVSASSEDIRNWIGTSNMTNMNGINQASIVIELQYNGLKMLFTGDSDSDLWYNLIEKQYDLIKLSHHGTTKPNLKLLECTIADKILISTNGYNKHNMHPEKDTIARAIFAGNKNIYFNYKHPFQQLLENKQEEYNFNAFFEIKTIEL